MIRQNLFWKLFALAVAIGLWSYVNAERNPQSRKTFTVPIEARNLAKGYIAEFVDTREVLVTLYGAQKIVDAIRKEDVSAWVNVPNEGAENGSAEETQRVHARVSGVDQNELDVTVAPSKARLKTEAIRWKRLPVEVKFLSPPPLGYSYSEPEMEPSSVAISGRTSAVSRVSKAVIGVSGEQDSRVIDDDLKVLPVDAKGSVVSSVNVDVETVHLRLRFVEAPATKLVIVSPTLLGQPKFPAVITRVTVMPSTVTLEGRPAVLMGLSTVSTEPVQIDDAEATVSRDVALRVPDFARLLGRRNVRVTVYVTSPKTDAVKPH
jgi:YbbR domain-containing protein